MNASDELTTTTVLPAPNGVAPDLLKLDGPCLDLMSRWAMGHTREQTS
jgi:hypothetical protein